MTVFNSLSSFRGHKDPGYKGLFHFLFMSELPCVITEMEFVSGSTKPPLAIIV